MSEQLDDVTKYLTFSEAAKLVPGQPTSNCVLRWARFGLKTRGGCRVRLQYIRVGHKCFTRSEWLDDFYQATSDGDAPLFLAQDERANDARDELAAKDGRTYRIEVQVVKCPTCERTDIVHTGTRGKIRTYRCKVCRDPETKRFAHWRVEVVKV